MVVQCTDILTIELVAAIAGRFQQTGNVQERGLAGTGRSSHGHKFPLLHFDGEIAQCEGLDNLGAEGLG